jgi:hypothetical protein
VLFEGDDIGRWLQRDKQPATWAQLSTEQQERLSRLGIKPAEAPSPAPAAGHATKGGPSKAQQAFQRGVAALAQYVAREGADKPVPRAHSEEIAVDGETEPVSVKLGVWISNTKTRRDKLTPEQLDALRELGVEWAWARGLTAEQHRTHYRPPQSATGPPQRRDQHQRTPRDTNRQQNDLAIRQKCQRCIGNYCQRHRTHQPLPHQSHFHPNHRHFHAEPTPTNQRRSSCWSCSGHALPSAVAGWGVGCRC